MKKNEELNDLYNMCAAVFDRIYALMNFIFSKYTFTMQCMVLIYINSCTQEKRILTAVRRKSVYKQLYAGKAYINSYTQEKRI